MINRHPMYFIDTVEPTVHCGKEIGFVVTGGKYEIPYPIKPLPEWEHNLNTCTGCNDNHKAIIKERIELFKNFPNCCEWHKKLHTTKWFNKNDFKDVPEQFADKLFFSWFHILHYLDTDNWKKEVFDYLEYVISSFGDFPDGYGSPLWLHNYFAKLKYLLQRDSTSKTISKNEIDIRKKTVIEFLDKYYNPKKTNKKNKDTDFNVLIATYNKWLKIFPFEISFFANLKPHFEKQIPILNGKAEVNKYTGVAIVKMHTKSSLINGLLNRTNSLITQINTATLHKKGLLTEPQKIKLELVLNEREMKIKQGYVNNSKSEEQRYRSILKEWFADEKRFIDEVTPLLKALPPQQPETVKSDEVTKELHNHIFKGNAFEVFEKYHNNKSLAENSRTDLNLLFQLFKNDNLFVETVELKHYIQWLNKKYNYGLTELKKVDINSKPNIQRTNDYKEYKKTTLKQP